MIGARANLHQSLFFFQAQGVAIGLNFFPKAYAIALKYICLSGNSQNLQCYLFPKAARWVMLHCRGSIVGAGRALPLSVTCIFCDVFKSLTC
ncbi:MAG: hypothetical protein LBN95_11280 [Prevotellaceae bacterium]|nr:hypothetical protein [Prevotellaceae bacterium]